jgi:hypothetical protein
MGFGGSADVMHTHHRKVNLTLSLLNKRINNKIRHKIQKVSQKAHRNGSLKVRKLVSNAISALPTANVDLFV